MTQRELDILNILYKKGKPMIVMEICDAMKGLPQATVITTTRNLLKRNLIAVTGTTYSGTVRARQYIPTPAARQAVIDHYLAEFERISAIATIEDIQKAREEGA